MLLNAPQYQLTFLQKKLASSVHVILLHETHQYTSQIFDTFESKTSGTKCLCSYSHIQYQQWHITYFIQELVSITTANVLTFLHLQLQLSIFNILHVKRTTNLTFLLINISLRKAMRRWNMQDSSCILMVCDFTSTNCVHLLMYVADRINIC